MKKYIYRWAFVLLCVAMPLIYFGWASFWNILPTVIRDIIAIGVLLPLELIVFLIAGLLTEGRIINPMEGGISPLTGFVAGLLLYIPFAMLFYWFLKNWLAEEIIDLQNPWRIRIKKCLPLVILLPPILFGITIKKENVARQKENEVRQELLKTMRPINFGAPLLTLCILCHG